MFLLNNVLDIGYQTAVLMGLVLVVLFVVGKKIADRIGYTTISGACCVSLGAIMGYIFLDVIGYGIVLVAAYLLQSRLRGTCPI